MKPTMASSRGAALSVGVLMVVLCGVAGCASVVQTDAGGQDVADVDVTFGTLCPAAWPAGGSQCPRVGLVCQFGDDPRVPCRRIATCDATGWTAAPATCSTLPDCPHPGDGAAGQPCTTAPMNDMCINGWLACQCTNCGSPYPVQMCSGPTTWHCAAAPSATEASCPSPIPNLGTSCTAEGHLCAYDCEGTLARTCMAGIWVTTPQQNMCPISTRSAKRDIQYVTAEEADRIARDVSRTRLATYEYIDAAQSPGRHLGFIIEDQPAGSHAVAVDRGHVDLYGYTSMLLAAVQSQQRQMAAMQGEIDELRARVVAPQRGRAQPVTAARRMRGPMSAPTR